MFDNEEAIYALERNPMKNKAWTVFLELDIGGKRSKSLGHFVFRLHDQVVHVCMQCAKVVSSNPGQSKSETVDV